MKFYKYPKAQAGAAFMLGLILISLFVDYAFGLASSTILATIPFLAFHRSPDAWDVAATYETPELAAAALAKMGTHNIRTVDEEKTFLVNATKTAVSEGAKAERKLLLDGLDGQFKELTGVEKEAGIKTSDYITGIYKALSGKHKLQTEEFETFKTSKLSESDAAKEVKAQLDKFKLTAKAELEEANGTIATMKSNQFNYKVEASVQEAIGRIKPTLKENEYLDDVIKSRIASEFSKFKAVEHEGTIIYHNEDGTPAINKTDGNHLSTFSILEGIFESMVDQGRKAAGTGAGKTTTGTPGTVNKDSLRLKLPDTVQTKMQLMEHIATLTIDGNKVEPNSPLFNQLFDTNVVKEDGTHLPLR